MTDSIKYFISANSWLDHLTLEATWNGLTKIRDLLYVSTLVVDK